MSFADKLFSFEGRIGRGDWWLLGGSVFLIQLFVFFAVFQLQGGFGDLSPTLDANGKPVGPLGPEAGPAGLLWAILAAAAVGVWPTWALGVKRWHDRDKGAVWMLIQFVPYIGAIWALVEMGFLGGTRGPNRYGPGPGLKDSVADVFRDDGDSADRADAAIARWKTEARGATPAPAAAAWAAPAVAVAPTGGGGFGKRTSAPTVW